ncbi:hypothetical protein BLA55_02940 [Mycoplasmopsis pullorum]|uniref:ABC transmembrane type-1 domain-containing protein n=2 Tax=Mycoplasmopsis pullorum TaxID=48003 RepID=A0A1L4FSL7_9BACT|nr:hypothetical protein BLA55_02940 [Mycoplasmopsis pullorum]
MLIFIFLLNYFLTYFFPLPKKIEDLIKLNTGLINAQEYYDKYMLHYIPIHRALIYTLRTLTFNFGQISTVGDFDVTSVSESWIWNYWITRNLVGYKINLVSFIFAMILGIWLGYLAAKKRTQGTDYIINSFAILFLSVPAFILIPLINIFRSWIGGTINIDYSNPLWFLFNVDFNNDQMISYLIPIIIMTLINFAGIMQISRSAFIKVLTSEYYKFALLNGLPKIKIFIFYALKNSLSEIINIFPFLFTGIFVNNVFLETFFNVSGTWKNLYHLITWKENNAIIALTYLLSLTYGVSYIFVLIVKYIISPYKGVNNES